MLAQYAKRMFAMPVHRIELCFRLLGLITPLEGDRPGGGGKKQRFAYTGFNFPTAQLTTSSGNSNTPLRLLGTFSVAN